MINTDITIEQKLKRRAGRKEETVSLNLGP